MLSAHCCREEVGWVTEGSGWEQSRLGKGTWIYAFRSGKMDTLPWLPLELTLGDVERNPGEAGASVCVK